MNYHQQGISFITGVPISVQPFCGAKTQLSTQDLLQQFDIRKNQKEGEAMSKRKYRKHQWQKEKSVGRTKNGGRSVNIPLSFKDMVLGNPKTSDEENKRAIQEESHTTTSSTTMSSVACQVDIMIGIENEGVSGGSGPGNSTTPRVQLKTEDNTPIQGEELDSVLYHEVFGVLAPYQIEKEELVDVGKEEIRSEVGRKGKKEEHWCRECGKGFRRKEQLSSHEATHDHSPPHRCEPCGKVFSRREHWANHVAWHARPHRCTGCGKGFGRREHLSRHQAAGCPTLQGQKPHQGPLACHLCGKGFTRREHYVNHVRWHSGESPHVCALCHKAFTRKEHLKNHVRQHTGESPHRCKFCGRMFSRREHLVNHTRQHTGETPFRCEICPKAFARKDHLLNHTRLHSRDHFMALEPQVTLQQPSPL